MFTAIPQITLGCQDIIFYYLLTHSPANCASSPKLTSHPRSKKLNISLCLYTYCHLDNSLCLRDEWISTLLFQPAVIIALVKDIRLTISFIGALVEIFPILFLYSCTCLLTPAIHLFSVTNQKNFFKKNNPEEENVPIVAISFLCFLLCATDVLVCWFCPLELETAWAKVTQQTASSGINPSRLHSQLGRPC